MNFELQNNGHYFTSPLGIAYPYNPNAKRKYITGGGLL